MLELRKKYKRGSMTFMYSCIEYGWWLTLVGFGFLYLAWELYFGRLKEWATSFLGDHIDWYVTVPMISEWILYLGLSFILVAYLRANVMYRNYRFFLDEHGFNLSKGIFFVNETTIPYQQISNVKIARPYSYRLSGLAKLDISTNADNGSEKTKEKGDSYLLPIIDVKLARVLSQQLMTYATAARNGQSIENIYSKNESKDEDEDAGEELGEGEAIHEKIEKQKSPQA